MGITARDCQTLAEYREEVLKGMTQDEIAKRVGDGCSQAWVSQVENGHLCGHRHGVRDKFISAYQLVGQEEEFVRMVRNAAQLKAIKKPISETEPLMASAKTMPSAVAQIYSGSMANAQHVLALQQERKRVRA